MCQYIKVPVDQVHSDLTLRKRVNRHRVPFLNWNSNTVVVKKHTINKVSIHVPFLRRFLKGEI